MIYITLEVREMQQKTKMILGELEMEKTDNRYQAYVQILKEELVPATGCTEPIAVAYAAAKAREILGELPEKVKVLASGSIIKNVKSVIVPNTGRLKGLPAACAAGIIAGNATKKLEVIADVCENEKEAIRSYLEQVEITSEYMDNGVVFDLVVIVRKGTHSASVRIAETHTNIVHMEKDGETLLDKKVGNQKSEETKTDRSLLDMEGIWDFANTVELADVREILENQIACNMAIAEEGLKGNYGANIGKVLLKSYGDSVSVRAKAKAAAGSDARMNGCEMPVVINSGSGNQGITCCVPVVEYGKALGADEEQILRALVLSNLTAIHEKTGIGTLSAYCGAVSAGAGAGAGIAWLHGGDYQDVIHTVVNALAIVSGIVCDGAKASCAAKIASSVDAALLGYYMYCQGQEFKGGDGIVMNNIESTIQSIGYLGKEGMKETNEKIIELMMS